MIVKRTRLLAGLSAAALAASLSTHASAQDGATAAAAPPSDAVEAIVVTGTRVVRRTRLETVAPVDVISPQAIQHTGTTELAQALSTALPSLKLHCRWCRRRYGVLGSHSGSQGRAQVAQPVQQATGPPAAGG